MAYDDSKRPIVLIVEDEFLIRMDAVDMIRSAGFDVVEAQNADEAILVLEDRLDITVVFTDIQMPGSMDGLKLAAAIRGRWPPIMIVATSGMVKITKWTYRLAATSCPSHTVRLRSSGRFAI